MKQPSVGRTVIFHMGLLAAPINNTHEHPATITRVHGDTGMINLHVMFDSHGSEPRTSIPYSEMPTDNPSWRWPEMIGERATWAEPTSEGQPTGPIPGVGGPTGPGPSDAAMAEDVQPISQAEAEFREQVEKLLDQYQHAKTADEAHDASDALKQLGVSFEITPDGKRSWARLGDMPQGDAGTSPAGQPA